jgi:hypothetical protein
LLVECHLSFVLYQEYLQAPGAQTFQNFGQDIPASEEDMHFFERHDQGWRDLSEFGVISQDD